jgi:hypothetical protein
MEAPNQLNISKQSGWQCLLGANWQGSWHRRDAGRVNLSLYSKQLINGLLIKRLKSIADKTFGYFQKVKLQPVQSILSVDDLENQ